MLEEFAKLSNDSAVVCRNAAKKILSHVVSKDGGELEYAATRLIRGLESHKLPTRKGSYTTLSVLLGLSDLKPGQLRDLLGKVLVTNQDTTKKERRLVYIARILALGSILRSVPISSLLKEGTLLADILTDLVELGQRRSTLLELATPFICCVLEDEAVTPEIFESTLWSCLVPLFSKSEVKLEDEEVEAAEKNQGICALRIAVECTERGLKTDFEFINDMEHVVKILLSDRVANIDQIIGLVVKYVKKNEMAESFWDSLVPQIRSSHFDTVCICVEKSIAEGIPHNIIVRQEIVNPLLGVFRGEDASQQQAMAVSTLKRLLDWNNPTAAEMGKKERKAVMKTLFSGTPNLLHEYKSLLRIIKPFLSGTCKPKDLVVLTSILEKQLNKSGLSVRMGIVYLQVLARIGQTTKALDETKIAIGKRLLNIGLGVEKLNFSKGQKDDTAEKSDADEAEDDEDEDIELLVKKSSLESFQSVLASSYSSGFINEMISFVLEEINAFTEDAGIKKTLKKIEKQRNKVEDPHLKYILAAYGIQVIIEQDKILGEAKSTVEELLTISKSTSKNDATTASEIVKFIISTVTKDAQPPFNFETMFSRFVIEDKITDEAIQAFADAVDVEVDETAADDDSDEDSSDEENDGKNLMDLDMGSQSDDEEDDETSDVEPSLKIKAKKVTQKQQDDDEDSDSDAGMEDINMDEETEEDLKNMDNALAKVFATKKKVKEEQHSEVRSLMRIFRLLEAFFTRASRNCQVSIPLMLLMPIIHSLQNSIRGKKNMELSTKVVTALNKLNGIRKFEGIESIESGTLLNMAKDISATLKNGRNKMIADLLGDSVTMLTKCYLQGSNKTNGETLGFLHLYLGLIDLEDDKRNKSMGVVSNIVSTALTTLPNWAEGKEAISKKLLTMIFDPEVRMFRKLQFLTLLRAALTDRTHSSEDASFSTWKVKATEILAKNAGQHLSGTTFETRALKTFTVELLVTLNDAKKIPLLVKAVNTFTKSIKGNNVVIGKLTKFGKLKTLLSSLDISATKMESGKANGVEKRKIGKLESVGEPKDKKSKNK